MQRGLVVLNIVYAVVDTIVAALGIASFGWGAWHFGKWWMLLFAIIPLALFNTHTLVIQGDIQGAIKPQKEGETDSIR